MAKKHMKRCSTSLIIREMKIKTTVRYHFTPIRMAIIKSAGEGNCWCGIWRNRELPWLPISMTPAGRYSHKKSFTSGLFSQGPNIAYAARPLRIFESF